MKTAVDSSVLLDVLGADRAFGTRSREALRAAYDAGALLACDVVWAEVRAHFASDAEFLEALSLLGITFDSISAEAAADAGRRWAASRGAARRHRVVADFLIGAHAARHADTLLTRDRGFFRQAFRDLRIVDPTAR